MTPVAVTAFTSTSAAGVGNQAFQQALEAGRSGLRSNDFTAHPLEAWIGRVDGLESLPLPRELAEFECRNNRLAWLALQQDGFDRSVADAVARHGSARVAIVAGTSTASIGETEDAYARLQSDGSFPPESRRSAVHTPHSLGHFLAHALQVDGPCVTVATACSSSAKVFAQAERYLRLGLADAVVVAGVDTLCGSVLFGFNSLELVSPQPCQPFGLNRSGISLGEAAGFALLEREGAALAWLLGHGESSDAHHMSSPHPEGLGARLALEQALQRAGIAAGDIDYVNLHGTASGKNDEVEARVVTDFFPERVAVSSTKSWTGHTLGAAGILEAVVCLLAMRHGFAPGNPLNGPLDPLCGPQWNAEGRRLPVRTTVTESFGFGGNNCVLVFADRVPQ